MPNQDIFQSGAVSIGRKYRGTARLLRSGLTILTGYSPYVPKHLIIAPQDLRTADASYAQEYYSGRYVLGGSLVDTGGKSPFELKNEDEGWKRELHSFRWLRNLSAASDQLSGSLAKSLIRDWIRLESKSGDEISWDIEVTAKRLISWLQHSILILSIPDHAFHQEFMQSLGLHVRFLKRHAAVAAPGIPKLTAYMALSFASVCFSGHASSLKFSRNKLNQELEAQILADGSHISRNPQAIVQILSYLLPFRQSCLAVDLEPSGSVIDACERLLLAARFFRLGDGNLARFNGSGVTESDLLTTVLRYEDTVNPDFINSSSGGYQRLDCEHATILMDAGHPPKGELSQNSNAGCLSFEFSSGSDCIVVNAGTPLYQKPNVPAHWRLTAAHSVAVFYETSSCKFENSGQSDNSLRGQLFSNSLKVMCERFSDDRFETLQAHHHGYVREFGARHQRSLKLDKATGCITGEDWFSGPDKGDLLYTTKDIVTVHFHLHPNVEAHYLEDSSDILLQTRNGSGWRFSCETLKPQIEESIFFAALTGARKTNQIVLRFHACKTPQVNWRFTPLNTKKVTADGS